MASRATVRLLGGLILLAFLADTTRARAQYEPAPEPAEAPEPSAEASASPIGAPGLPLAWSERPLTLTQHTLRGDLAFGMRRVARYDFDPMTGRVDILSHEVAVALSLGAGFGLTDDVEVGAQVLPLSISPDFEYAGPSLYGLFRFASGFADVGALLRATLPVETDFKLYGGLPVLLHLSPAVRLDTGVFLDLTFADRGVEENEPYFSIVVPVELAINATPEVFFGANTSVFFPDLTDDGAPVQLAGVFVGYTVPAAQGPVADLRLRFQFPELIDYDPLPGLDAVRVDQWELVFQAHAYFDF